MIGETGFQGLNFPKPFACRCSRSRAAAAVAGRGEQQQQQQSNGIKGGVATADMCLIGAEQH